MKQAIVASTRITYDEQEVLQLLCSYIRSKVIVFDLFDRYICRDFKKQQIFFHKKLI